MATTTSLSAAKCKAFLAELKEHILDAAETTGPSVVSSWKRRRFSAHCRALLAMEMLQRGVLLTDFSSVFIDNESSSSSTDDDDDDDDKKGTVLILNAIADCAGKTLLKESSSSSPSTCLPRPLLAGSAAMAGRVAQIVAASFTLQHDSSLLRGNDDDMLLGVDDSTILESTRQRCLEVQDDRFLVLLRLLFSQGSNGGVGSSSSNDGTSEQEQHEKKMEHAASFLAVAEGYFCRAASFQPDAPPTWKRAWDVVVERNQLPLLQQQQLHQQQQQHQQTTTSATIVTTTTATASWDAIPAVTQLRRIALTKGNAARASELALVLVRSYLDCPPTEEILDDNTSNNSATTNKTLLHQTHQVFVRPIIVSMKLEPSASRRPYAIRQAAQILSLLVEQQQQQHQQDDNDSADDTNSFLTLCLKVQVALNLEQDVFIHERACHLHQSALRRRDDMAGAAVNAKKRGIGGGGGNKAATTTAAVPAVLTLEEAHEKARLEYAWKTASLTMPDRSSNDDFNFDSADYLVVAGLKANAVALRAALLEETGKDDESSKIQHEHKFLAFAMLEWYLQSRKDQARARALVYQQKLAKPSTANSAATSFKVVNEAWMSIRNFVQPILQIYKNSILSQAETTGKEDDKQDVWLSESERKFVQTCALLVPCTFWMLGDYDGDGDHGGDDNKRHHVDMLQAAYHILSALQQNATSQWDNAKASAAQIISGTSSTNSSLLAQEAVALTSALVSTRCWLEFFGTPLLEPKSSFNILETLAKLQQAAAATSSSGGGSSSIGKTVKQDTPRQGEQHENQSIAQSSAEYGTNFLTCLISWAGLHQDAWKSCSTLPEVRRLVQCARQTIDMATRRWGRQHHQQPKSHQTTPISIEDMLLDLAQADAESSFGSDGGGGFSTKLAQRLYQQVLDSTTSQNSKSTSSLSPSLQLVQAHCYTGLARLLVSTFGTRDIAISKSSSSSSSVEADLRRAEALTRQGLDVLESLSAQQQNGPLLLWKGGATSSDDFNDKDHVTATIFATAVPFQLTAARQWTAQAILLQNGRTFEALEILQAAVREAPLDATAAFTLGALQLRQALLPSLEVGSADNSCTTPPVSAAHLKSAQLQLLKAAKLDSTKANPFALLGYWYETSGDKKRAVGCYKKALFLDQTQPVAGRGLLRLASTTTTTDILEQALAASGGLNGWAWQATGLQKSMFHGQDDLAVVAFLKASRSRDIAQPHSEPLSIFFAPPPSKSTCEKSLPQKMTDLIVVLSELANCYRRLGRYTAAIRTFQLAIDSGGENVSTDLLCACGHVELELGLFEESAEKFSLAVEKSKMTSTNISAVAAYGHGQALLAMAQQDLHDGKAGAALAHVLLAIEGCERSESTSCCMSKLRGDLHSFSASLPTRLFGERDEESVLKCHIDVVAHGEAAYLQAKEAVVAPNEEEKSLLCGSLLCDLACNTLLQAQLLAQWHCTGTDSAMKSLPSAVADAFNRAADKFRQAIQLSPLYAPAWCGLGCSLSASKDNSDTMMLAQHAFCRALQLDPLFPDAYANLAFLYTSKDAFTVSERVTDALTQVADSPMMWINRALILERRAAANQPNNSSIVKDQAQEFTQQASDAYRAAVQVVKPPSVVLGLAATGRIAPEVPDWDYKSYCTEYKAMSTGSILDKELIKIFRSPGAGEERSSIPPNADDAGPISTAALVVREPNRGELWLKLARELVVSRDNDKSEKHSADDALSAETAARRAASIFMLQLTDLTSSSSLGNAHRTAAPGVDAKEISEALTLVQWLDSSLPKQDVMVDDSDSAQQAFPRPSVDLQRALLMNPQNRLTREAIRQSQ